jgi:tripartite-type tricarboxylate transporter receptor subunit TctC
MNMAPLALTALALCLELLDAADPVAAQDYPTQPIKIVVAAAAGGPSTSPGPVQPKA